METKIDKAAHGLLNYFEESTREPKKNLKILQGTSITHLGEIRNATYTRKDITGRKIEWHRSLEKAGLIGFNQKVYMHVSKVANQIFEISKFGEHSTIGFIEEMLCEWVFLKYDDEDVPEPYSYLVQRLNDELEDYIFYFPLEAIEIEHNFKIGNCHVICFDEYFELNEVEKFKLGSTNHTEQQFNSVLQKLKGRIVAVITSKGILERAEKDAKYKVQLTINLLKVFLIKESIDSNVTICDLEFNSCLLPKYNMFFQTSKDSFDLTSGIRSNIGVHPVQITSDVLDGYRKNGLDKLSSFIKKEGTNEIDQMISRTIMEMGNYTSERNIYERVIKIISIFESIFVPQRKGKGKGLTIIKSKVLPRILRKSDLETGIKIFVEHYRIRDKYLHNRVELPIDGNKLFQFQHIAIILIIKLLDYKENYQTEDKLGEFFEIN